MREIETFIKNNDGTIYKHMYGKCKDEDVLKTLSAMVAAYKFEEENNINR